MHARLLNTRMLKELDVINKSMTVTSKALQSEINCFRHKFSKHETKVSPSGSEANDVRMYETHNPGFCFHRNGQYRKQNLNTESSTYWYIMNAYQYVFTDGEIDPEKVVSLHLLTVHSLEISCTPKSRKIISHSIAKSIPEYEKPDYESMLPLYWLESHFVETNVARMKQDDMKEVRLINKNIELLTGMIMTILSDINVPKYLKIMDLARNTNKVVQMLSRPATKRMFEALGKTPILTHLKNYSLTSRTNVEDHMVKLIMPLSCTDAEYYVDRIRMRLLKEMKRLCNRCDLSQTIINSEIKIRKEFEMCSSENVIEEFDVVEPSAKHQGLKQKKTIFKLKNLNDAAIRLIAKHKLESEESRKESSISDMFRNMNNAQRIRVGTKVAQMKENTADPEEVRKKVSVIDVMQQVLSKRSMENLLSSSFNEKDRNYFKSHEEVVQPAEVNSSSESQQARQRTSKEYDLIDRYSLPSDHLMENKSIILFATIRQDVISKETDKKVTRFLSK